MGAAIGEGTHLSEYGTNLPLMSLKRRVETRMANDIRRALGRHARRHRRADLERIGSDYGGWIIPTAMVAPDWTCYSGGVGEDLSFDIGMIDRFGCRIFAFDPTPRAIHFVEHGALDSSRFTFLPVGLWSEDSTQRFYAPRDPSHVSHSIANLQETTTYFDAECRSLPSLMRELSHEHIDLLKIDIEGAEHAVLASALGAGIRPAVICTEIDQPVHPIRFIVTLATIFRAGYSLMAVDKWNLTFVLAAIRRSAGDG